jgi:hypothetical protein
MLPHLEVIPLTCYPPELSHTILETVRLYHEGLGTRTGISEDPSSFVNWYSE